MEMFWQHSTQFTQRVRLSSYHALVFTYKSVRRTIQDKNLITLNSPQKGASACKFMVCRNGNNISPVNRLKVVQFKINLLKYFLDSLD